MPINRLQIAPRVISRRVLPKSRLVDAELVLELVSTWHVHFDGQPALSQQVIVGRIPDTQLLRCDYFDLDFDIFVPLYY
jgi:hypothetical protein